MSLAIQKKRARQEEEQVEQDVNLSGYTEPLEAESIEEAKKQLQRRQKVLLEQSRVDEWFRYCHRYTEEHPDGSWYPDGMAQLFK